MENLVKLDSGYLVADDSTLDKPYAPHIELVTRHWSAKHRAVVEGINLITLLWTDGDISIPVDWCVLDKESDGLSKNDHLRQMLETAPERGFKPDCVLWDSWYSSLAVCRTMKLSIHRGKELLAFKITCSNSFLPILFFLNESTGWNKRDGALKCAYTLIQTRHNRIFSTWFTQYMHPF